MAWLRSLTWSRVAWMVVQAWIVAIPTWAAITVKDDVPAVLRVPMVFLLACLCAIAFTVVGTLLYELFRYTLPRLIA